MLEQNDYSWNRARTDDELGDFISQKLAALENINLDDAVEPSC